MASRQRGEAAGARRALPFPLPEVPHAPPFPAPTLVCVRRPARPSALRARRVRRGHLRDRVPRRESRRRQAGGREPDRGPLGAAQRRAGHRPAGRADRRRGALRVHRARRRPIPRRLRPRVVARAAARLGAEHPADGLAVPDAHARRLGGRRLRLAADHPLDRRGVAAQQLRRAGGTDRAQLQRRGPRADDPRHRHRGHRRPRGPADHRRARPGRRQPHDDQPGLHARELPLDRVRVLENSSTTARSAHPRVRPRVEPLLRLRRPAGPGDERLPPGPRAAGRSADRQRLPLGHRRADRRGLPPAARPARGADPKPAEPRDPVRRGRRRPPSVPRRRLHAAAARDEARREPDARQVVRHGLVRARLGRDGHRARARPLRRGVRDADVGAAERRDGGRQVGPPLRRSPRQGRRLHGDGHRQTAGAAPRRRGSRSPCRSGQRSAMGSVPPPRSSCCCRTRR